MISGPEKAGGRGQLASAKMGSGLWRTEPWIVSVTFVIHAIAKHANLAPRCAPHV